VGLSVERPEELCRVTDLKGHLQIQFGREGLGRRSHKEETTCDRGRGSSTDWPANTFGWRVSETRELSIFVG
jgi:hypothetical protein